MLPIGTNTARRDMDVARMASISSFVASAEAIFGRLPSSMWRKIFSTRTMASSIKKPTASERPMRDMLFIVKSSVRIRKKVEMTDTGMARPPMIVARRSPKKRYVMRSARNPPKMIVFHTSPTFSRMKRDWSLMILTLISGGRSLFSMAESSSLTLSMTLTVFVLDCFLTDMRTDGTPFVREYVSSSSQASSTSATSVR